MNTIMMKKSTIFLLFLFQAIFTYGSDSKGLHLRLNETGSHYVKATVLNQVWLRYNQSNTGTLVNGVAAPSTFDIGLRRTRIQLYGQLHDRVFFYTQFGMNNFNYLHQNAGNRKLQAFFHDALAEYHVFNAGNKLKIGGGLTIANGLSRFSQPGVSSIMTLDVPVFAQATVDQTDEFSRKLSLYVRGQLGKLDYRFIMSDPFPIYTNGQAVPPLSANAVFSSGKHHKQLQGLLIWNFGDKEPHTTPYMAGTYLGKKKVLNLEAGVISQKKATWTGNGADTSYHPLLLWSVAGFMDRPLNGKGTALNAYLGYFLTDYGPGYIRSNGIMNPANGHDGRSFSGAGNAYPMFGTGKVLYSQIGYKFRDNLFKEKGTLMPYASFQLADYRRLQSYVMVFNTGINWLLDGQRSKVSLDYQSRPEYRTDINGNISQNRSLSSLTMQYQVFF